MLVAACVLTAGAILWHVFGVEIWGRAGLFTTNGIDSLVYRGGGLAVWEGRSIYGMPTYRMWQFTYTPFAAMVLVPLAWLPPGGAVLGVRIVNVICLLLLVYLSLRALGFRRDRRFWLAVVLFAAGFTVVEPVRTTIWNGQVNLLLAVVILACLTLPTGRWRGLGVGLAAGVKLTPMFFLCYFALTRQWRAMAVAVATFAATVLLALAVLRGRAWEYWSVALFDTSRIGPVVWPANQSINGYLARLRRFGLWDSPEWLWVPIGTAVALVCLWAVWRAHRAGATLLAITITGMTSAAVSPMAWAHHWVWFVPLLLLTISHAAGRMRRDRPLTWLWWLAPIGVYAACVTWYRELPSGGYAFGSYRQFEVIGLDSARGVAALVASGSYLIVLLVTVGVTLWWTGRADPIRFTPTPAAEPASAG